MSAPAFVSNQWLKEQLDKENADIKVLEVTWIKPTYEEYKK